MITQQLNCDANGLAAAVGILRSGGLVAFPTETVYGLGADARNDLAVAKVFAAKGRPSFNPLIVHVPDLETAQCYGVLGADDLALAAAFWPGPLTLVVPKRAGAGLSDLVTAGLPTVAIRVPAAAVARDLLRRFAGPVAAPSANPSGRISPTRAAHVLDGLDGRIEAVVLGGAADVGIESTIIGAGQVLRAGGVAVEQIEAILGGPLALAPEGGGVSAPGQLASHYAPRAQVRLQATGPQQGEVWLGFGPQDGLADVNLSATGDLTEAAANLFHALRQLDAMARPICVSPVPETGLGRAINDRLRRAAAPRP